MKFEHLIQINDPENPLIDTLTRDQLWQGLLHRVENPIPFLPGLESCTILEREADTLLRELDFGPAVIQDRVTLADMTSVRFDIQPSETHPGGSLHISIEEPEPTFLFLRFAYQTTLATNPTSIACASSARWLPAACRSKKGRKRVTFRPSTVNRKKGQKTKFLLEAYAVSSRSFIRRLVMPGNPRSRRGNRRYDHRSSLPERE